MEDLKSYMFYSIVNENFWPCVVYNVFKTNRSEVKWKLLSPVQLFVTPRTVDYQALLFMEFSRQEY